MALPAPDAAGYRTSARLASERLSPTRLACAAATRHMRTMESTGRSAAPSSGRLLRRFARSGSTLLYNMLRHAVSGVHMPEMESSGRNARRNR